MSFEKAVNNTVGVAACYRKGLQAMGNYSTSVQVTDTRKLTGSVDIDNCVRAAYPNDNRWDYAVGYGDSVCFIEVHPAKGGASEVIAKKQWLERWLKADGKQIGAIGHQSFFWVPTNGVRLMGKYGRQLAEKGIRIENPVRLR